jgi:hypothetical protein
MQIYHKTGSDPVIKRLIRVPVISFPELRLSFVSEEHRLGAEIVIFMDILILTLK